MQPSNSPIVVHRTINAASGRALEMLGHAIEYLEDELHLEHIWAFDKSGSLHAIEILKAKSREIYLCCPIQRSLAQKIVTFMNAIHSKMNRLRHTVPEEKMQDRRTWR